MKKQKKPAKKIVLAITGGFGTGKTTVAGYLREYGAKVIDADKIARSLIKPGSTAYKKIINAFGCSVLKKDKSINRLRLSGLVFNNKSRLNKLNKIIHPQVVRIMKKGIIRAKEKIVVLDVPLLFEAKLQLLADKVVVVTLSRQIQLKRLLKKARFSKRDILGRIKAQMPLSVKVRRADFVIDNNGMRSTTEEQIKKLRRMLWKN